MHPEEPDPRVDQNAYTLSWVLRIQSEVCARFNIHIHHTLPVFRKSNLGAHHLAVRPKPISSAPGKYHTAKSDPQAPVKIRKEGEWEIISYLPGLFEHA